MATATIGRVHGPHPRTAEPCTICLAAAQPHAPRPRDTRFRPQVDALLPWILALAFLLPLASALDGGARTLAVGLIAGVLVGAAFAWQLHARDRATGLAATARVRAEIGAESDARANALLKQFEWAVNDIASLRTKLEKAEREVREHAQHAFVAERDVRRLERNARLRDRRSAVRAVKQAHPKPSTTPWSDKIWFARTSSAVVSSRVIRRKGLRHLNVHLEPVPQRENPSSLRYAELMIHENLPAAIQDLSARIIAIRDSL